MERGEPEAQIIVEAHLMWRWLDTLVAINYALHDQGLHNQADIVGRVCNELRTLSFEEVQ